MVLVMGISFQARHYDLGGSVTATKSSSSSWHIQAKEILVYLVLCASLGRLEISYRGGQGGQCLVSDGLEKRSP